MSQSIRGIVLAGLGFLALSLPALAQKPSAAPSPAPTSTPASAYPWAGAPGAKQFPNASAIILKDDIQAIVNEDGTHDLVEYDAIKLLDRNGVERFKNTPRLFDSRVETCEVALARLWSPDGHVSDVPRSAITVVAPEGLARDVLYQHIRELDIDFKDAAEGSVVEFRIVHHRKVPWNGHKFWEISYTQDFEPILDTQFTFNSPDRMAVEIATPGASSLQPESVQRQNGRTIMHWHMKDRAALVRQPAMPALRQLASQIQVSNFKDWTDFANWAHALWEPLVAVDADITARTATVVAGRSDDEGRIRAIMAFLAKDKQAANGDLSLEDIAPASAAQALKVSDLLPADRATLLVAMLRSVGLKAWPALVATADYGDPTRGVPSLQQFNRVLVVLPAASGWRWLDPMAPSPGVLGQGLDGRPALVLNGSKGLVTTDQTPPQVNREEINGVARLDADGSMETVLNISEYGANSMIWRAMATTTTPKDQQQVFQQIVSNINPTAMLRDSFLPAQDASKPDGPLQMQIGFEASRAGIRPPGGEGFQFAIPLLPQRRLAGYAEVPTSMRLYPLLLGATVYEERRLQIVIPAGWSVKSIPHPVNRSNTLGSFQVDVRNDDRNIWYFSRLIVRRSEIPVAEYGQFKELMDQVSASATEQVVLGTPPRTEK